MNETDEIIRAIKDRINVLEHHYTHMEQIGRTDLLNKIDARINELDNVIDMINNITED